MSVNLCSLGNCTSAARASLITSAETWVTAGGEEGEREEGGRGERGGLKCSQFRGPN